MDAGAWHGRTDSVRPADIERPRRRVEPAALDRWPSGRGRRRAVPDPARRRTRPPGPVRQAMAVKRGPPSDLARNTGRSELYRARHAGTSTNRRAARQEDARASLPDVLPVRMARCAIAKEKRAVDDQRPVASKPFAVPHHEVRLDRGAAAGWDRHGRGSGRAPATKVADEHVTRRRRRGQPELNRDSTDDPRRRIRSMCTLQCHRRARPIPYRDRGCVVPTGDAAELHPVGA